MKSLVLLLLVIGTILITTSYHQQLRDNFQEKVIIEYRYLPRSFYEEQLQPTNIQQSFHDMFNKDNVFMGQV